MVFLTVNMLYSQETKIYLIRHAEKADSSSDPELSDKGKTRSERWGAYFKDKDISFIYTTPFNRTKQTIIPVARLEGKKTMLVYEPAEMDLAMIANKHSGKNILIVGHSNTIPAYINKFIGEVKYPDMTEDEYGNLYIITVKGKDVKHELVKM